MFVGDFYKCVFFLINQNHFYKLLLEICCIKNGDTHKFACFTLYTESKATFLTMFKYIVQAARTLYRMGNDIFYK